MTKTKTKGKLKLDIRIPYRGENVRITSVAWKPGFADSTEVLVDVYYDQRTCPLHKWSGIRYVETYDPSFRRNLRVALTKLARARRLPALPWEKLDWTESGMQGDNYASMILGRW